MKDPIAMTTMLHCQIPINRIHLQLAKEQNMYVGKKSIPHQDFKVFFLTGTEYIE
jgi:hypothetical protein